MQYLPYSIPANVEIVAVPRPINHKGFAPQFVVSDKTPEPAVVAVVAVVAHDEQAVGRNGKRGEIVTGGVCRRDRVRVLVDGIGVVLGLAIHEDLLVALLDNITGYAHHAFDIIHFRVAREFKDDNIPPVRFFDRNQRLVGEGHANAVDKFIDQDMVPDEQGILHGTGWDFKGLYDKRTDEKGQHDRQQDGFNILPDAGFLFRFDVVFMR